jgi:hypothetical protein
MKLKLSCLLSICFLMGSCSGGTSSRVADSGTSYPISSTDTPSTSAPTGTGAANLQRLMNNQAGINATLVDPTSQGYTNLGNSIRQQGCTYNAAGDWVC